MFIQIARIKQVDTTPEQAINSYGSFVKLYDKTKARVKKSKRKGWSNERVLLSKANQSIAAIQEAVAEKFGVRALHAAIEAHPFSH